MKKRWLIIPLLLVAVPVAAVQALKLPVFGVRPSAEDQARFAASEAFDVENGVFKNRRAELFAQMRERTSVWAIMKEWFSEREDGRPTQLLPQQTPDWEAFLEPSVGTKLIWFGHSTFLLNLAGTTVLVDPIFSDTAAPVSFTAKRFQAPVVPIEDLPPIDILLISHDHYDHLDMQSVMFYANSQTMFVAPLGVGGHLKRWGIDESLITERDWWQSFEAKGVEFTAVPAQHFSGRDGVNNNDTLWASWVLATPETRLYFSGDSGYDTHFKTIGERLGPFDLVFLENGQYDKAWPEVHMRPDETIQAFKDLKAKQFVPVHWGMFELAFHAWYAPVVASTELAEAEGLTMLTPMIGELLDFSAPVVTTRWWEALL